jgi:hypothetical protein
LFWFFSSRVPYVASFSRLFLFCFSSSRVPYVASFSGLFLFCLSSSCVPYVAIFSRLFFFVLFTLLRNWQQWAHKKKDEGESRETGNSGHTRKKKNENQEKLATLGTHEKRQRLPVSLDSPSSFFLCVQCCQFLWLVLSSLPLQFSLTFICPVSCVSNVARFTGLSILRFPISFL